MGTTRQPAPPPGEVTSLLQAWGEGDATARDRLMPLVYQELRRSGRRAWSSCASSGVSTSRRRPAPGVSVPTANRDWAMAKSWLYRRLKQTTG